MNRIFSKSLNTSMLCRGIVAILSTLVIVSITSCSTMQGVHARLTYDFKVDTSDERIFYEVGTEDAAAAIAENMGEYIEQIETSQFGQFRNSAKIEIYMFNDSKRFKRFRYNKGDSALGAATTNEIYISLPGIRERLSSDICKKDDCRETVEGILLHELSHVHTRQYLGSWSYVTGVPTWFNEGLAVYVSSGAGAGRITEEDAKQSILSGSHILAHNSGRYFKRSETVGKLRFGSFHYNRQSTMFVEFLINESPAGFQAALKEIRAGRKFRTVWKRNYETSIADLWTKFTLSL